MRSLAMLFHRLTNIKTILVAFILLGAIYSVITPIFEASDELWHYPLVQWLSKGNPLPIQDPNNVGPWKQEASQPPLYYYLMGWATFWIDTSDMPAVLRPNPHADNGVITRDGNISLVVHDPVREAFPWRGTVLAVHLVRLLSVLMGAATVWLTYRIALEILPPLSSPPRSGGDRGRALLAAAVNAFTPMFVFISAAVNNDNLTMLLCSLALLLMVKRLRAPDEPATPGFRVGRWAPLGIVLGLGALTKTSALGLLPLAALTVGVVAWKRRSWPEFFSGALATALPVLLLAGWWYLRNIQLYGDVTGLNAFIDVLGKRAAPASLPQLWGERWGFMLAYWGLFGGVNVPLDEWVYHALNALAWIAFIGAIAYLVRITLRWFRTDGGAGLGRETFGRRRLLHNLRDYVQGRMPLFLVGLFGVIVVAALTQWATVTWSSQGRLVFSAISAWSIFFVLGLVEWSSFKSVARWIAAGVVAFMFVISAVAPFTTIAPAYARPVPAPQPEALDVRLDPIFGDRIKLIGANVDARAVKPGESIEIVLYWQAVAPIDRDYYTFVHLLDPNDIVVAQRLMFPGQGLWPTSQIKVGDIIPSRYVLQIPATAYTPDRLIWEIGLCEKCDSGEPRLPASGGGDNVRFGSVALERRPGELPNPVAYNLGNQIDLIGYDMDRRVAAPGETIQLTLYWRARAQMPIEYTVFTHILERPETLWAQDDKPLAPPTTTWTVGQVVSDTYDLTIKPDAPAGVYEVEIGVYHAATPAFERLRVITDDGRITENYILLSQVRVAR
ncbi:MAG TPA: glycosyltransferase family 39 protein [Anaerolineae bacterium]|nr:glycosyltransferase family 39 protein [Anaerolineae bacterium]